MVGERESLGRKLYAWLDERIHLRYVLDYFAAKSVPRHKYSFWYIFGGLTFFFLCIQITSGLLLLLYYQPTPEAAHKSVQHIITDVPFGKTIRSIHIWSSHFMIGALLIHLMSSFLMRAYRKPRELLWLSGAGLLFLVLAFGFTGYLLPWDMTAYFATQIGTEIPRSIPLIGEFISTVIRGGQWTDGSTLSRMFAIHVALLPLLTITLGATHILLNQVLGSSVPQGIAETGEPIRFFPNYFFRDLMLWLGAFGVLLALASFFPFHIGTKADPYASAPDGIKPEWYFLPLYQTLRMFPAQLLTLNGEMIVNSIVVLLSAFIVAIPFLDTGSSQDWPAKLLRLGGMIFFLYSGLAVFLAYFT